MTASFDSSVLATTGILVLVAWRLFARVRRAIGRQRFSSTRPWISVVVFPLVIAAMAVHALVRPGDDGAPALLLGLLAGMAAGLGLGVCGTRLTRFEVTPAGLFYTPNAHLGVALTLLFVLRLGYRAMHLHLTGQPFDASSMRLGGSPLTLGIFGTLAGYYVAYAVGLLRWRASVRAGA